MKTSQEPNSPQWEKKWDKAVSKRKGYPGLHDANGSNTNVYCTAWGEGQKCCLEEQWAKDLVASLIKAEREAAVREAKFSGLTEFELTVKYPGVRFISINGKIDSIAAIEAVRLAAVESFAEKVKGSLPFRGWNTEGTAEVDSYDAGIKTAHEAIDQLVEEERNG